MVVLKSTAEKNLKLWNAAKNGKLEEVRKLIREGAEFDYKNQLGLTPLFIAIWSDQVAFFMRKTRLYIDRILIADKVGLNNEQNQPQFEPLSAAEHSACLGGSCAGPQRH